MCYLLEKLINCYNVNSSDLIVALISSAISGIATCISIVAAIRYSKKVF